MMEFRTNVEAHSEESCSSISIQEDASAGTSDSRRVPFAEVDSDRKYCPTCRSMELVEIVRGDTICQECGRVLDDTQLETGLVFQKDSDGRIHLQGTHLDLDSVGFTAVTGIEGYQINRCAQEITLNKNKHELRAKAVSLKCDQADVFGDAWEIYKKAFRYRFTVGRRFLLPACLFIACRKNETSHSIQDFLSVCDGKLAQLRKTVRFLVTHLVIELPSLDPCLSVERFCEELFREEDLSSQLKTKIKALAMDIVKRMKKDWIDQGRRPAGVTAAAMVIACRVHGMDVDPREISAIAGLTIQTIRKRLTEFARTDSATLAPGDFRASDLPSAKYHPSFYNHLSTEKKIFVDPTDRTNYTSQVHKSVRLLKMAEDPGNELHKRMSVEHKESLQTALSSLLTTIEILEHAVDPPLTKSLFYATDSSDSITEDDFLSGGNVIQTDMLRSLLTNAAEHLIRRENLIMKFGSLISKRAERKVAKEAACDGETHRLGEKRQKKCSSIQYTYGRPRLNGHGQRRTCQTALIDQERFQAVLDEDAASEIISNRSWCSLSSASTNVASFRISHVSVIDSNSWRCKYFFI